MSCSYTSILIGRPKLSQFFDRGFSLRISCVKVTNSLLRRRRRDAILASFLPFLVINRYFGKSVPIQELLHQSFDNFHDLVHSRRIRSGHGVLGAKMEMGWG